MNQLTIRQIFLVTVCAFLAGCGSVQTGEPPAAKKIPKEIVIHGDKRTDNYFWLQEKNSPDVLSHLKSENRYTEAVMKHTESLQDKLYKEMVGRINETDETVPYKEGNYYHYSRTEKGKQYSIYCRKKGSLEAAEEIILDVNEIAKGKEFCDIWSFKMSSDHKIMAYGVDFNGDYIFDLYFKGLESGEYLDDVIKEIDTFAWANDNKTIYYTLLDHAKRPYKVFRHKLGTSVKSDVLLFHEKDESCHVSVSNTRSREYTIIDSGGYSLAEVMYLSTDDPEGVFKVVEPRKKDMLYSVDHSGGYFYIRTNDEAKNYKIVKAPVSDPSKKNWIEVMPHRKGAKILHIELFKNHLVAGMRQDSFRRMEILNLSTNKSHVINSDEQLYMFWSSFDNRNFNTNIVRYEYMSYLTPVCVYDYNMDTAERQLKKRDLVNNYDGSLYEQKRIFAKAADGASVPISLVYKKGIKLDGINPLLLYGYGSYGASIDPWFNSELFSLLDRGFIYAVAHVRGGGELGEEWFESGKLFNKKNTYTDFIACAERLIKERYTSSSKLAIRGVSAGGMLIGAVINMRPDLFKAAVADVPFVDILNTMLDEAIPLTVIEFDLWGNPVKSKEHYDYIKSYSAYDNISHKSYPHVLATTGVNDAAVQYWEPSKWIAKLREYNEGDTNIILRVNLGAGHQGSSGRYDKIKETAFRYAFILDKLGIN
ncbi:MAG: S9 family peptidase [Planctomycetes bacterium]|nr:S9 family peptidase [Planctomycetota bacterium]